MSRHTLPTTVVNHPPRFSTPLVSERLRRRPGFLDGVVRFADRAEHPVGHRPQVASVLLESLCQPILFVHRSHLLVAFRHCSDERNPADVTRR